MHLGDSKRAASIPLWAYRMMGRLAPGVPLSLPGCNEFVVLRSKGPHKDWAPACEDLRGCYEMGYTATMLVVVKAVLGDTDWYQPLARAIELAKLNKEPSVGE